MKKFIPIYLVGAALLLAGSAALKWLDLTRGPLYARFPDPVASFTLGTNAISTGIVMGVAASLESISALYLFIGRMSGRKLRLLKTLALVFVAYRMGLYLSGAEQPCRCLGSLGDWLRLSPNGLTHLAWTALGYLMIAFFIREKARGAQWVATERSEVCC